MSKKLRVFFRHLSIRPSFVIPRQALLNRVERYTDASFSVALVWFNHATPDPPNLCVMGKHVHAPIAPPEKRAQNPANNADNDRTPKRAPEMIHMESDDNA